MRVEGGGAGVQDAAVVDHAVFRGGLVGCGVGKKRIPVGEHQLHRVEHGHGAGGGCVQALAQAAFQRAVVDPAVGFGDANALGKELYRLRGVATAAQADDGGQARVVPAGDVFVVHQLFEFAFAGDDVGEVEPRKFVLVRGRGAQQAAFDQAVQQPVVKRALVFKLQRADAVGDLLQRVLYRVGKGVHGVDAPFVAGVVVVGAADAVDGGVAQVDVGRRHVDFCSQNHSAIGMQSAGHLLKTLQMVLCRQSAEGAVGAGVAKVAPVVAHVVGRLFIDVGVAGGDEVLCRAVHEVEVVAGLVGFV